MSARPREGRGRLSSIDLLPDDAEAEIIWALEELRERRQPQVAILAEFNARLADRGVAGVSKSAFSRWSIRKALQFRRLDEVR
ncbi:MAG: phage protein Gp27 family protein, partial [Pseudomonadota bacterium]